MRLYFPQNHDEILIPSPNELGSYERAITLDIDKDIEQQEEPHTLPVVGANWYNHLRRHHPAKWKLYKPHDLSTEQEKYITVYSQNGMLHLDSTTWMTTIYENFINAGCMA